MTPEEFKTLAEKTASRQLTDPEKAALLQAATSNLDSLFEILESLPKAS